jgi:hypothetical protein
MPSILYDNRDPEYWKLAVAGACKYSDYPSTLRKFISLYDVRFTRQGKRKYFPEDKDEREVLMVSIENPEGKKCQFDFGMSLRDTMLLYTEYGLGMMSEVYEYGKLLTTKQMSMRREEKRNLWIGVLYSILCCVKSDCSCPEAFDDFCAEYGYDEDSRSAFNLYEKCHKQARDLQRVIDRKWIHSFPS